MTLWPASSYPTQLSITSSNTNPNANQKFTISGTLENNTANSARIVNKPVYLEAATSTPLGYSWIRISADKNTAAGGAYAFTGYISAPGDYYVRAHYDGLYPYQENESQVIHVHVGP